MATLYNPFTGNMKIFFDIFQRCLDRAARTNCDNITQNMTLNQNKWNTV